MNLCNNKKNVSINQTSNNAFFYRKGKNFKKIFNSLIEVKDVSKEESTNFLFYILKGCGFIFEVIENVKEFSIKIHYNKLFYDRNIINILNSYFKVIKNTKNYYKKISEIDYNGIEDLLL